MSVLGVLAVLFVIALTAFLSFWAGSRYEYRHWEWITDEWEAACQFHRGRYWQARQVAATERERKHIVEEQRLRLARLLREFDRCEHCRQYRKAHEPGISFCDGFSLGEPADPLETVIEGKSASELADKEDDPLTHYKRMLEAQQKHQKRYADLQREFANRAAEIPMNAPAAN